MHGPAPLAGADGPLVDRELYLPKSWTTDRDRCEAAKIPDDRDFFDAPRRPKSPRRDRCSSLIPESDADMAQWVVPSGLIVWNPV
ncbi:hypothetical protein GCM10010330_41680 [Streptomyces tendae]|nr:hypothetical protein GCM10010330_41680 [Streptomyces tendae]